MKHHPFRPGITLPAVLLLAFGLYPGSDSSADNQTQRWIADASAATVSNPIDANRRSLRSGERLYQQRCAVCHGEQGAGDGPGGRALNPRPANLTADFTQSQGDGQLYWKISRGRGAMPGWQAILDDDERWHLVNYIKSLGSERQ